MSSIEKSILSSDSAKLDNKGFPINPFPDVEPNEFHKLNKKEVTEDFVEENLRLMKWEVYHPFVDSGIDRIIMKNVCPNGHTTYNEALSDKCEICGENPINITRYIQVKTRELKKEKNNPNLKFYGYTLKSKDFRTDPRHIFLLYSDHTMDFLFISVLDYLAFFNETGFNHPATPTFKQGNGKINSLKYDTIKDEWFFSTGKGKKNQNSWEHFRNDKGLKRIQNPIIDLKRDDLSNEIKILRNKLFRKLEKGRTFTDDQIIQINSFLDNKDENILEVRNDTLNYLSKILSSEIKKSVNDSYWFKFKGLEIK
ncbi:hypothetical protein [Methanobacterium sp. ACI-7]|uniref:hypothetical protein n=1 Tax=unclassified Methanobacterium TaxID=2627676 RepID=UPI0039C42DE1